MIGQIWFSRASKASVHRLMQHNQYRIYRYTPLYRSSNDRRGESMSSRMLPVIGRLTRIVINVYSGASVSFVPVVSHNSLDGSNFTLETRRHQGWTRALLPASFTPSFFLPSLHSAHGFSRRRTHGVSASCIFWNKSKITRTWERCLNKYFTNNRARSNKIHR